jgi:hypothetical protein
VKQEENSLSECTVVNHYDMMNLVGKCGIQGLLECASGVFSNFASRTNRDEAERLTEIAVVFHALAEIAKGETQPDSADWYGTVISDFRHSDLKRNPNTDQDLIADSWT